MTVSVFTLANLTDIRVAATVVTFATGTSGTMTVSGTVLVSAAAGPFTLTLPSISAGQAVTVKKTESGANAITVTPPTGQIDNAATATIAGGALNKATYLWDGANWWIVG